MRHEAGSHLGDEVKRHSIINAHNQSIERMPGCVAANYKLLALLELVLLPCAATTTRLIKRTFVLGDDALKLKFFSCAHQVSGFCIERCRLKYRIFDFGECARQKLAPLLDWQVCQVTATMNHQVKGVEL